MVVMFTDKSVKPEDRHKGNAFIHQDFLFNEGDDNGDRILMHDRFIKRGPFLVLQDSPFQGRQPVPAARPFLAFNEKRPVLPAGDDVILSSRSVQGFYGTDGNGKLMFFKNERHKLLKILPDTCFGHGLELPDTSDIFEVRVAGPVRILGNIWYGKTLPAGLRLHPLLHIIRERGV
jgi:hypothetical protein